MENACHCGNIMRRFPSYLATSHRRQVSDHETIGCGPLDQFQGSLQVFVQLCQTNPATAVFRISQQFQTKTAMKWNNYEVEQEQSMDLAHFLACSFATDSLPHRSVKPWSDPSPLEFLVSYPNICVISLPHFLLSDLESILHPSAIASSIILRWMSHKKQPYWQAVALTRILL